MRIFFQSLHQFVKTLQLLFGRHNLLRLTLAGLTIIDILRQTALKLSTSIGNRFVKGRAKLLLLLGGIGNINLARNGLTLHRSLNLLEDIQHLLANLWIARPRIFCDILIVVATMLTNTFGKHTKIVVQGVCPFVRKTASTMHLCQVDNGTARFVVSTSTLAATSTKGNAQFSVQRQSTRTDTNQIGQVHQSIISGIEELLTLIGIHPITKLATTETKRVKHVLTSHIASLAIVFHAYTGQTLQGRQLKILTLVVKKTGRSFRTRHISLRFLAGVKRSILHGLAIRCSARNHKFAIFFTDAIQLVANLPNRNNSVKLFTRTEHHHIAILVTNGIMAVGTPTRLRLLRVIRNKRLARVGIAYHKTIHINHCRSTAVRIGKVTQIVLLFPSRLTIASTLLDTLHRRVLTSHAYLLAKVFYLGRR